MQKISQEQNIASLCIRTWNLLSLKQYVYQKNIYYVPDYLLGLTRALLFFFSDNLSRNSFIHLIWQWRALTNAPFSGSHIVTVPVSDMAKVTLSPVGSLSSVTRGGSRGKNRGELSVRENPMVGQGSSRDRAKILKIGITK